MATLNHALKKLSKYGEVKQFKTRNNSYYLERDGKIVTVIANGGDYSGEVAVIQVQSVNDPDDYQMDYHGGCFADNISQAIRLAHWE